MNEHDSDVESDSRAAVIPPDHIARVPAPKLCTKTAAATMKLGGGWGKPGGRHGRLGIGSVVTFKLY